MKPYNINSKEAVAEFLFELMDVHGCNAHPDDSLTEHVDVLNGQQCFTKEVAEYLDGVMDQCHDYCNKNGLDIYDIALDQYFKFIQD